MQQMATWEEFIPELQAIMERKATGVSEFLNFEGTIDHPPVSAHEPLPTAVPQTTWELEQILQKAFGDIATVNGIESPHEMAFGRSYHYVGAVTIGYDGQTVGYVMVDVTHPTHGTNLDPAIPGIRCELPLGWPYQNASHEATKKIIRDHLRRFKEAYDGRIRIPSISINKPHNGTSVRLSDTGYDAFRSLGWPIGKRGVPRKKIEGAWL